ncbi:TonB-dependent receptor [Sphingomonas carotinifaciens]|uniref:TonB-dependent receptor n=1 Tax=Sphingomonas carotinifaciens TaxID=1166323 RepID=A0A1G7LZY6_9SPHN|nr:TonB-dependent receptor [Sphingomonas carotinifaciens]MBB4086971.1 TonB-dependent receptor [Sphingomonas carotinifaciens]MWC42165.1 TonB-dependent receptor [Sphingomonas carotinifaciens]SDF55067.1 TonB-dependent receptor [Sphingomonas carotinifaciens]
MKALLLCGAALLACGALPAGAQSNANSVADTGTPQADRPEQPRGPSEEAADEDIVVTGIRASLRSSVATKRNADNIVDSISAEDTGKFPDNNVAESLQRITGVAIDRSGGEGQFITVRGLGPEFNTVLVNGRIMATDNDGREFSFDVLSSNMIQRTDVYKSTLPQLQEGGIGATVNVVTARPLDGKAGLNLAAAAGGIYDGLADKLSPDVSGVVSWTNSAKTFGAVFAASYTDRRSQRDFVDLNGWILGSQRQVNAATTATGLQPTIGTVLTQSGQIHTPRNLNFNRESQQRERLNLSGAIQAQLNDAALLTIDGLYSKFNVKSVNRFFGVFYTEPFIGLTTDANGTVTGFNRPGTQFVNANPALNAASLGDNRVTASQNDNVVTSVDRRTESYQFGANVAVDLTDSLTMKFDASTTKATRNQPRQFLVVGSLAQTAPRFDLTPENDLPTASNLGPITDASLLRAHYGLNEFVRVKDEGSEFHIDGEWKADDGIFQKLLFGLSYNKRQKVRTVASNTGTDCTYCGYDVPIPSSLVQAFTLDGFLNKASGSKNVPSSFFTFNPADVFAYISQPSVLAIPRQGRTAAEQAAEAARLLAIAGGPYGLRDQPGQTLNVTEKVAAIYINAMFGSDNWSANVGGRLVDTKLVSRGFGQFVLGITRNPGDDNLLITLGAAQPVQVRNSYTNFLPSANIKYDIDAQTILRGAVSQTVTRPTLTSLGVDNSYGGRVTNAVSSGGNATLRPFRSTNYDLSLEHYFNAVSYVSLSGFYKSFKDFLETQTLSVPLFGYNFQDTRTRNGQSGSIAGVEVGGQYTLDSLPGILSGLGVAGNYTYVSSNVDRGSGTASNAGCGYNGLSPHSANGSVFYEKFGIQARASYNWRSSFLRACFGAASRPENRDSYGQFDASIAYDVTPQLQVYVQGVNLTSAYVNDYSVLEDRFLLLQNTGSRYLFGVRARF